MAIQKAYSMNNPGDFNTTAIFLNEFNLYIC